ncbi:MAG: hypothetical protein GTO55_02410 [Armatimonadetes bacterium]|nr:hypothetical protein [Armatimonadota bacterium]NIM23132.1 hypothetical protein [Armatimonadota bacterium]NIM67000.1 hypothetical protein [Armatimonadota bacterium]NIM75534.1 hypothetical protein [Armatimonadota bacterium]NIN05189.1 hypothetical protein [Armatimonadota bacterium]
MTDPQHENGGAFPTLTLLPRSVWRGIRWLWRKTWRFSIALLILLIIAHIIFNFTAGRRLEAELARIRGAGDPLTVSEVAPPPVPDSENAALVYQQAFEGLPADEDNEIIADFISLPEHGEYPRPTLAQVEEILAAHEKELQLLEEASLMPAARFPVKWEVGFAAIFPHLAKMRGATRLLCAKALAEAHRGHSGEALESLAVIVRMGNHAATEPTIVAQLVRAAMMGILFASLPEILATAPPTAAESRAFYDLLDEVDVINPYVTAMKTERCNGLWAFDLVRRDGVFSAIQEIHQRLPRAAERALTRAWPVIRPVWEPLLKLDKIRYLQTMAQIVKLSHKTYAQSRDDYPQLKEQPQQVWYAPVSSMLSPVYPRLHGKRDGLLAELRVAQAALALRAYQIEHGEYPDSLEQIGERWEIEKDPFTGKPLVYQRVGDGYFIYSLGPDLTDNKGIDLRTARQGKAGIPSTEFTYDIPLRMSR